MTATIMTDTLLSIIAALFGGLNIFQFLFFRSTKKKYEAEANKAQVEAAHGRVDLQQDQYDYVNAQLTKIQTEYYALADKYRATMTEHLQEIDGKCNEIATLKSKLAYFKGLRCYQSSCANRIFDSPYKKNSNEENL